MDDDDCFNLYLCVCVRACALHAGANPLLTNGLGHTARAYAKEGDVNTMLQEWEVKVCPTACRC